MRPAQIDVLATGRSPGEGEEERPEEPVKAHGTRRGLLLGGLAALASGAAGVALGYRHRTEIRGLKLALLAYPNDVPAGSNDFRRDAERILAARDRATAETVARLKARYESPVYGRVRVWDLVEKLALCIDPTDMRLFCGSQFVHLQQILAAMEQNGVDDPDMYVLAIVHDLGKVLLAAGEAPENVVGGTGLIEAGAAGAGLDEAVFQFGHGEFVYSRLVGHVPDHVAWVARYHNVSVSQTEPFMNERDREWTEKYLLPFKRFDGDFVSPYFLPRVDLERYRALIERTFPQPLLV